MAHDVYMTFMMVNPIPAYWRIICSCILSHRSQYSVYKIGFCCVFTGEVKEKREAHREYRRAISEGHSVFAVCLQVR